MGPEVSVVRLAQEQVCRGSGTGQAELTPAGVAQVSQGPEEPLPKKSEMIHLSSFVSKACKCVWILQCPVEIQVSLGY